MAAAGFPSLSNTRYEDLIQDFGENDPNAVITWCQENGLISEIKRCPEQGCNNVMTLANRTGKDGENVALPATLPKDIVYTFRHFLRRIKPTHFNNNKVYLQFSSDCVGGARRLMELILYRDR